MTTHCVGLEATAPGRHRRLARRAALAHQEERDGHLIALWARQVTYDAIARQFAFANRGVAYRAVRAALQRRRQELGGSTEEIIRRELAGLDELERRLWTELAGRPRKGPDGQPLLDAAGGLILDPPEAAEVRGLAREIIRLKARRAAMLALDAQPLAGGAGEAEAAGRIVPGHPWFEALVLVRAELGAGPPGGSVSAGGPSQAEAGAVRGPAAPAAPTGGERDPRLREDIARDRAEEERGEDGEEVDGERRAGR